MWREWEKEREEGQRDSERRIKRNREGEGEKMKIYYREENKRTEEMEERDIGKKREKREE